MSDHAVAECVARAKALWAQDNRAEAERVLADAVARFPENAAAWSALGKLQRSLARFAECSASLAQAAKIAPSAAIFTLLGDVAMQQSLRRGAAEHYRAALKRAPGDFKALRTFCYAASSDSLDEVISLLEAFRARGSLPPADNASSLLLLINYKERAERIRRGLPPMQVLQPADLGFHFTRAEVAQWRAAADDWVGKEPGSPLSHHMLALACLASGDLASAAAEFTALRPGRRDLVGATYLEPGLLDSLPQDPVAAARDSLPPVTQITPLAAGCSNVLFVGCDLKYAETYALPLLASLRQQGTRALAIALHIFDARAGALEAFLERARSIAGAPVAISHETTGLSGGEGAPSAQARGYYHVARLVRFMEILERTPGLTGWHLDADLLFNGSPAALYDTLTGHDVAAFLMPGRIEPENQIAACVLGVAPTEIGRRYLRGVAGYLLRCIGQNTLPWGTDQLALFAVYVDMARQSRPDMVGLPPSVYGGGFGADKVLWPGKCDRDSPDYPILAEALARFRDA